MIINLRAYEYDQEVEYSVWISKENGTEVPTHSSIIMRGQEIVESLLGDSIVEIVRYSKEYFSEKRIDIVSPLKITGKPKSLDFEYIEDTFGVKVEYMSYRQKLEELTKIENEKLENLSKIDKNSKIEYKAASDAHTDAANERGKFIGNMSKRGHNYNDNYAEYE